MSDKVSSPCCAPAYFNDAQKSLSSRVSHYERVLRVAMLPGLQGLERDLLGVDTLEAQAPRSIHGVPPRE
eukprot:4549251-Amphidinium_carterae.1